MPTRRPHTKSRHGCLTCKSRKVRCDEEKPSCRNCLRGDRVCAYPNHLLSIPQTVHSDAQEQVFPLRDLELLHYWSCYTYSTVTDDESQFGIWQEVIPRLAFSYRFLLHGMLALTTLHRRYEAGEVQQASLMGVARYHQQYALTLYIPELSRLDQQNCHALFAFSIVLGALSFGLLRDRHDDDFSVKEGQGIITRIIDAFDAFIGASAVGLHATEWLRQGPLRSYMVPLEPIKHEISVTETDFQAALETLVTVCHGPTFEGDEIEQSVRDAYLSAVYGLATILAQSQDPRQMKITQLVAWPVIAELPYMALLKQGDPLALVILGHYGVALHLYCNSLWMLEGLGKRVVEAVYFKLDDIWRPYVAWAKSKVEVSPPSSEGLSGFSPALQTDDSEFGSILNDTSNQVSSSAPALLEHAENAGP